MSTNIQTLHDVLYALAVTAGIAVALVIAFLAAGALSSRDRAAVAEAPRYVTTPAQRLTQADDAREQVLL